MFVKKSAKNLAFLTKNKTKLCKILIITLVFEKNAIFLPKIGKIAENCDHNIDPRSPEVRMQTVGSFWSAAAWVAGSASRSALKILVSSPDSFWSRLPSTSCGKSIW
jgi:hypothetical protein